MIDLTSQLRNALYIYIIKVIDASEVGKDISYAVPVCRLDLGANFLLRQPGKVLNMLAFRVNLSRHNMGFVEE